MSYIIKSTSPFVSIKLTETGRENLAKGQLNFSSFALGDSEINYEREEIVDANSTNTVLSATSKVFRPFDRQPNIKSFITTSNGNYLYPLNSSNISVVKATVYNEATQRGFFSGTTTAFTTYSSTTYVKGVANIANSSLNGSNTITVPLSIGIVVGDVIRIKLTNSTATEAPLDNLAPLPSLWFKAQSVAGGTSVTLDRNLPNNSAESGNSYLFVYHGGEIDTSFGYSNSTAYWDSGTLSFDSSTNITCDDVKVWNMNNVWCETIAGVTGLTSTNLYEDYTKYGSYTYLGTKNPYLEYVCEPTASTINFECNGPGYGYPDDVKKAISIIHYTNNTISNLYGEFFHVDTATGKLTRLFLPTLMYHRRNYGTASGTTMGMSFVSSGTSKNIGNSNVNYFDLIEDPSYIGSLSPKVVGKVFPQLKIVVIDDDEIVAAISYKSNRNWTLPALSAFLYTPSGGTSTGVLDVGKTIYVTYQLTNDSGTGLGQSLPCQYYTKVTNNSSAPKDISFNIENVDYFPYMRKIEAGGYDGFGFYANKFKLLYQIVDSNIDRPDPSAWKVYDYTNVAITQTAGQTINPKLLENQSPVTNGFILTKLIDSYSGTGIFNLIDALSLAPNTDPTLLQFGDERFFYGNVRSFIGATIYKTIFDIRVNSASSVATTNPTRSQNASTNPPNIKVTEVGIYDNNNNLVIIGKLSNPVPLIAGNTIMFELSMDF